MTPFQKQQVMTAARAEFARSPKLQDEFGEPEIYAAFVAAEKAGLIRARHPEENPKRLDADRQAFLGTYTRVLAAHPEFRDLWPEGFDQAYAHHIRNQQMRAATVAFGVPAPRPAAPPITARTMPTRPRMPH